MSADRYLVTGATGFVGANLAHRLVADGATVFALVRPSSSHARLSAVADRIQFVTADLTDPAAVAAAVSQIQPTVVFHTAAISLYSREQPPSDAEVVGTNLLGTIHLLTACVNPSLVAFINTGSSSEYGPCTRPMREADAPHPRDAYGVSKCAATLYASAVGRRGAPVLTLRLFSPYGPLDDPRRFVPTAITAALAGTAVAAADPTAGRDYVYIDDVVAAYRCAAETAAKLGGAVFNIGSGRQSTLAEVTAAIARHIPNAPKPAWGKYPRGAQDNPLWQADLTQAQKHLGWSPQVTLDDGIGRTIQWQREHVPRKH